MATVSMSTQAIVGGADYLQQVPLGVALPANANAAPPQPVTLAAGNNTIQCPSVASGYTVTGFKILPVAAGSTNAKTLKGINGDTGVPFLLLAAAGCVAGGSFVVTSTSSENCMIVWF